MVILEPDGSRAALFVDALVGQPGGKILEANYRHVPCVSGAPPSWGRARGLDR